MRVPAFDGTGGAVLVTRLVPLALLALADVCHGFLDLACEPCVGLTAGQSHVAARDAAARVLTVWSPLRPPAYTQDGPAGPGTVDLLAYPAHLVWRVTIDRGPSSGVYTTRFISVARLRRAMNGPSPKARKKA